LTDNRKMNVPHSLRIRAGVSTLLVVVTFASIGSPSPSTAQSAPSISSQIVDENGNPVIDPAVSSTTLLQISIPAGATTKPPKATRATTTRKRKTTKPPATAAITTATPTTVASASQSPDNTGVIKVGKSSATEPPAKGVDATITTILPPDEVPNAISEETWLALRKCESNNRYDINTGNGYYGAYQFAAGTWRKLGYSGLPHRAAPVVQDEAAKRLQASSGWGPWPACTRKLGLR
jgi:Transglycosylase-like domain